ncbi:trihydroxytoluene oxygenase [Aspergillus flavus AF70]|nr:trihydroxytoluene oxygenase [Aspergillus flavus AF70]
MALANHGASIQDLIAIGDEQENVTDWQRRCGINKDSQIRLVKLAHMRYQHPDLDQITTFLQDFGMTVAKRTEDEAWYRGASQRPTASDIQELSDVPGGGFLDTLTNPEEFPVNLMFGQKPAEKGAIPEKLTINYEEEKPRIRKFQGFTPGPAAVHKLGHFGLCTGKFEELVHFYTTTFNIVPTDFLYVEKDGRRKNVALFAHIDRGDDYVDHHSFFMSTNASSHVHHCSFEVHDFDTQKLGHQWLTDKKYKSVWGVGRHILGSQIFDYWWDTTGNMIEHYTDGDLVNNQTPIGYGPAGDESLAVWGPEVPAWFLK